MRRVVVAVLAMVMVVRTTDAQWFNHPDPRLPRGPDGRPHLNAPVPRAPDGRPDLSGRWLLGANKYNVNIMADMRPEDAPFQSWAAAMYQARLAKDDPNMRCMPPGVPRYLNSMFKIVQTPDMVAVLYEIHTLYRQIFTDGRTLPVNPNPSWLGYSIGRWEGDVLVVDSTGFNDKTWLDFYGHPHSEALHVVERFSRRDVGSMDVQVTIDDPVAYTRPWTVTYVLRLAPDTEMLETICENDAQILPRLVGTVPAHPPTRRSIVIDREQLARFAGTYEVAPGRAIVVSAAADRLLITFPGNPEPYPMFAEAPDRFFVTVGDSVIEFQSNADGRITGLVNRFAQGQQAAVRIVP
jgi:hypothetical protein